MRIFDNKGLTIIELIAALSLLAIVLPMMYGVFISGIKTYQSIQIEALLRDDGDYTSSIILNELYAFPFDEVQSCSTDLEKNNNKENISTTDSSFLLQGERCIKLIDNKSFGLIKKPTTNQQASALEKVALDKKAQSEMIIKLAPIEKNGKLIEVFTINNKPIEVTSNFQQSTISVQALKNMHNENGSNNMITFNFFISDLTNNHSLTIVSQFGY